jgi:hypothetical protein
MTRGSRKQARILHGFAGIALSFVTVECVLHAIEATPVWRVLPIVEREPGWPDPVTGYALRPAQAIINVREQRARVTTNSAGMRDRERTIEKPAGTYRVAVTGDSFTEALQVADDETFTRRAERRLNAGDRQERFELLNFGMSGAGPVQQLLRAQHAATAFSPDALVMLVNVRQLQARLLTNDSLSPAYVRTADGDLALGYRFRERRSQRLRDSFTGRFFFALMDHSRIARAVYLYIAHRGAAAAVMASASASPLACEQVHTRLRRAAQAWGASAPRAANAALDAWLRDVEAFAEVRGMPVALVFLGLGMPRADCPAATAERAALLERIRRRITPAGFTVRDGDAEAARIAAAASITGPLNGFGRSLGSGHLNDAGHRVYARLLSEQVLNLARPGSLEPR